MRTVKIVLLGVCLVLTAMNISQDIQLFKAPVLFPGGNFVPGKEFLFLKPYIAGLRGVGLRLWPGSKFSTRNARLMFVFQRAKYALLPTIVNYDEPAGYEFTIYYAPRAFDELRIRAGKNKGTMVASNGKDIMLVRTRGDL